MHRRDFLVPPMFPQSQFELIDLAMRDSISLGPQGYGKYLQYKQPKFET